MRHWVIFSLFCIFIIQSAISKTDSLESVSLTCLSVKFNRDKIFRFYLQEVKIPSWPSQPQEGPILSSPVRAPATKVSLFLQNWRWVS